VWGVGGEEARIIYNLTTGRRKVNKRGVERVEVLVVVDTPWQGDFGGIGFLQGRKEGDIFKRSRRRL